MWLLYHVLQWFKGVHTEFQELHTASTTEANRRIRVAMVYKSESVRAKSENNAIIKKKPSSNNNVKGSTRVPRVPEFFLGGGLDIKKTIVSRAPLSGVGEDWVEIVIPHQVTVIVIIFIIVVIIVVFAVIVMIINILTR